jgi:L-asparaginase II
MPDSELLVRVFRGTLCECSHRGHMVVTDLQGRILHFAGNPRHITFARSSAKLLQAIPVVESGAVEKYGLSERETAVICASHNGEEEHTATVLSILSKLGCTPEALLCGAHEPFHPGAAENLRKRGAAPSVLHNNCSGKHSGMLALARQLGVSGSRYTAPEHPVQQRMLQTVSAMCGLSAESIILGTDGCGVPVFGLPIDRLAYAFARFGAPEGLPPERQAACRTLLRAIRRYPEMLAGHDRYDTLLIEATQGRVVGKMGAEGIFALTVPESGLGMVVKIEDGSARALYPAVTEALLQLGLLRPGEAGRLSEFHKPVLKNWRGDPVGKIEPDFLLHSAGS